MFTLLGNIFSNLFGSPATRKYPFVRRSRPQGTRGALEIEIDKCIFCGLCAKRCPSNALKVVRDPKSWTVDPYRCILCSLCMEACPKKCLYMNTEHSPVNR